MALVLFNLFIAGTMIGSFLNVVVHRVPRRQSIVFPGSHCPACGHPLAAWENIPILSYLVLKGHCRHCSKSIPVRYPAVELLTGGAAVLVALEFGLTVKALVAFLLTAMAVVVSATDIDHKVIPNRVLVPVAGIAFVLLGTAFLPAGSLLPLVGKAGVVQTLAGLVIGGGILIIPALIKEDWMGAGDIKMMAVVGMFLGYYVAFAVFIGSLLGSVVGAGLILRGKIKRGESLPFGPFLAAGSLLTLFVGPELWDFYLSFWPYLVK